LLVNWVISATHCCWKLDEQGASTLPDTPRPFLPTVNLHPGQTGVSDNASVTSSRKPFHW